MPTLRAFKDVWWYFVGLNGADTAYAALQARYSEPHRRYHTLAHIAYCLKQVERVADVLNDPMAVKMAIWYHDAVYETTRDGKIVTDNEERSAKLCEETLREAGTAKHYIDQITRLIMATTHRQDKPIGGDGMRLVDIDLAILSEPWEMYKQYMKGIKFEYRYGDTISEKAYCEGRIQFLQKMTARDTIYNREPFTLRHNELARENMRREANILTSRLSCL